MTKLGFTMTSFVAAIPGAFLCYFLVMAFMTQFEHMSTIMMVLAGITLLIALIVALMPFGVLVFFKSAPKTEGTDLAAGTSTIEEDAEVDDLEDDDDSFDGEDAEVDSFDDDGFESDGEIAEATDDFDDDDDEFSFDDEEDDDGEDMVSEASDDDDDDDDEFNFGFDDDDE